MQVVLNCLQYCLKVCPLCYSVQCYFGVQGRLKLSIYLLMCGGTKGSGSFLIDALLSLLLTLTRLSFVARRSISPTPAINLHAHCLTLYDFLSWCT